MKLTTIYGSPTPPGKLARGLGLVEDYVHTAHTTWDTDRISSKSLDPVTGIWEDDAIARVEDADAVVIASPVFRGSFPGTLKLLIDMLPNSALRSKPVGIFTVAAAPHHFLSAERHLRDILSWFGALTAPNSVFFVDRRLAEGEDDEEVYSDLREFTDQVIALAEKNAGTCFGPAPLHVKMTSNR